MKFICFSVLFVLFIFTNAYVTENVKRQLSLQAGKADILILMSDKGGLDSLKVNGKRVEDLDEITRGRVVVRQKMKVAKETQAPILKILKTLNIRLKSYWVANVIAAYQVPQNVIQSLNFRQDIRLISSNREFQAALLPEEKLLKENTKKSKTVEWNVEWVKAPAVWEMGYEGEGIVTGNADTGIQYDHPALKTSYRGNLGDNKSYNHNYNWFDGLRDFPSCGTCPCKGKVPCDDQGHGTHCMGTTSGGVDRKIGIAPKSKWIGCRAFSDRARRASPATFLSCLQFFAAPTDLEGENPNPDVRPHTTSHSYGCPTFYCPNSEFLLEAAETLKKEGVFMIVAAGNSGNRCSTVNRPPGHMGNVYTVGASNTRSNTLARFSSRGPITLDRSGRMKPDITAPGVSVVSSIINGRYGTYSGTSMAAPAVNGCVALIWEAVPSLRRKIDETIKIISESATPMASNECSSNGVPNNLYGYGIINVEAAVKNAIRKYGRK